jgi:AcrR family transcriptional regulator
LYFTFDTKAELLQAAFEHAVLGPEATPPHLTAWWGVAEREPDVARAVAHIVDGTIEVFQRTAPLVWAVHGDEDARATYEFNEQLRREGYAILVAFLARKHPLRPGLTQPKARVLLTLLGPHVFVLLTRELGWSVREFATWARAALLRELFGLGP